MTKEKDILKVFKIILLAGLFYIGVVVGMYTGHVVVLRDDGSVCAEIK